MHKSKQVILTTPKAFKDLHGLVSEGQELVSLQLLVQRPGLDAHLLGHEME